MKRNPVPFLNLLPIVPILMALAQVPVLGTEKGHNTYVPNAFPAKVSTRIFSIPMDPDGVLVVYPESLEGKKGNLERALVQKCGSSIPCRSAAGVRPEELRGKHLILLGNILDNPLLLDMYMKRRAFADAYFPGKQGVIIHPAKSAWDPAMNVLVVGVSRDEDLELGFATFLEQLKNGDKSIGVIHVLKTPHPLPQPPQSVEAEFGAVKKDPTIRPPYRTIAEWGFNYFLTGEKKWAELFLESCRVVERRAEVSGKWIAEPWSNIYFALWNIFRAWMLIDDDPLFSAEDRRVVEEVLWGYTRYIQSKPYHDEDKMQLDEPRQNHSTFLALSLDHAYRYYTEKYGLSGLEEMAVKVRRCMDRGQAASYRPNDDGGGGYQVLAPSHLIHYSMEKGDRAFIESGKLRTLVDLMAATIDNRGDPVTFGDIGEISHRKTGGPQRTELQFFSLAAWAYKEGAYQWLYNWFGKDSTANLDPWSPIGLGLYAAGIKEEPPRRFEGILPVLLDEGALRYSARRSERPSQLPVAGKKYIDKVSFRCNFDPQDEYLLLDGTSTFSHGHQDGNTVTRLTWKDRIWLGEAHYIKAGPHEHNGVIVVRDGVQAPPPPLNELNGVADFEALGMTKTTSNDYNGADWQRHILWKKGQYFLFLDRVVAGRSGNFRLESRWRTRGDVRLEGNNLTVRQGDKSFAIKSADGAARKLVSMPDEPNGEWDYPYGPDATIISLAQKNLTLLAGSDWTFANLMYAADDPLKDAKELLKAGEGLYAVKDANGSDYVGLGAGPLEKAGLRTDCEFFAQSSGRLCLLNLTRLGWGTAEISASVPVNLEINGKDFSGFLVVPAEGEFAFKGIQLKNIPPASAGGEFKTRLKPGKYDVKFEGKLPYQDLAAYYEAALLKVNPESPKIKPPDFGLEIRKKVDASEPITASYVDGDKVLYGTNLGRVIKFDGNEQTLLFELPEKKPLLTLYTADINKDGRSEILSGDNSENLFCHDSAGTMLWRIKTDEYYRPDGNVVDIIAEDIDGNGSKTILAATRGWKLYAVSPDGRVRWECFIFYHALTKVRVLKNREKTYIVVGTVYETPINVVDPKTGVVIWKTWEQMGSESMSTTDYCDKHVRDMVFVDADGDGEKDIVFGTEYSSVYALKAADGKTLWKTLVGDKVSALRNYRSGQEERIVVGTEAGELYIVDKTGKRLHLTNLGSGITGMEVIDYPARERKDIILSTEDGRVAVYDEGFVPYASQSTGEVPVKRILPAGKSGEKLLFYAVGEKNVCLVEYHPYFLRPSRDY